MSDPYLRGGELGEELGMNVVLENGMGGPRLSATLWICLDINSLPFESKQFLKDKAALDSIKIRRHSDNTAQRHPDLFTPEGNSPVPRDLQKKRS